MICLGIESTAHSFGIGVVTGNGKILSNVIDMYRPPSGWGIEPMKASEHHKNVKERVLKEALEEAKLKIKDIDLIGFSQGAGLPPCLYIGLNFAKDLADNGATVVKIESSKRLDLTRLSPPFKDGIMDPDRSGFFVHSNTSKYSATLNLKHPKGIEVAKKLVRWADVVVENFGHGYMERIGLGYEDLKKIKSLRREELCRKKFH